MLSIEASFLSCDITAFRMTRTHFACFIYFLFDFCSSWNKGPITNAEESYLIAICGARLFILFFLPSDFSYEINDKNSDNPEWPNFYQE